MFCMIKPRLERRSITGPWNSPGISTVTSSNGSDFTPSISLIITCGCETESSYPSRRMFSSNTAMCISPRPYTSITSPVKSTCNPTLISSSFSSRAAICREVTYLPSRPANGEEFTKNCIPMVGSST